MAEMVAVKAVNARAKAWDAKDTRRDEAWSRTFNSWTGEQKWTAPLMTLAIVFLFSGVIFLGFDNKPSYKTSMGFWFDIFPLIVAGLIFLPLMALFPWMIVQMWRERKEAWER
ncbi:MAG: hypothetical protein EOO38_24250, partial [Cytophagaceae bacterium]